MRPTLICRNVSVRDFAYKERKFRAREMHAAMRRVETTDTAYNLAVQVIGNAFISRRSMIDCSGVDFIDLVLSDAVAALRRLGDDLHTAEALDNLTVVTAIVESLRGDDRHRPRGGTLSAA